jgi:predicted ester cyclase
MVSITTASICKVSSLYKAAFPNLKLENQQIIGQGDWIATIYHFSGTHQGSLALSVYLTNRPVATTNKRFNLWHYTISQWQDGRIVEIQVNIDTFEILGALVTSL